MLKSLVSIKTILLLCSFFLTNVYAQTPEELVKTTTDAILTALKVHQSTLEQDPGKIFALVDKIVLPHFDFERMSKLVLAQYWRTASTAQRQRFVHEFRALVVRTYATALLDYTDEKVHFLSSLGNVNDKRVTIRTEVRKPGGSIRIPINYEMYLPQENWKVYDVKVDNVSLVTTYRNAYKERIKNDGLDALIDTLAAKTKDALRLSPK
jgi:phospholipid transport system substrate-binding protein